MTYHRRKSAVTAVIMAILMALSVILLIPHDAYALGLNRTSFTLTKGYSTTLKVSGSSATPKWSSSDTSVATVSSSGKVVGRGAGTAKISCVVDGTTLTASVKVVGGKLSVSSSSVTLEDGSAKLITVRAKGSHGLKAESLDKSVVTTGWVKPWDNDDIHLKLTARGAGTATVKIYMTKYPDVVANVKVTVGSQSSVSASPTAVSVGVNETSNVTLTSSNNGNVNITVADPSVAQVSIGAWANNRATLAVKGLKAGSTRVTVTDKSNSSAAAVITVTVTQAQAQADYYKVSETQPTKKLATDQIYRFTSINGAQKYILVPQKYDEAQLNSAVSGDTKIYDYNKVYATAPVKRAANDIVKEFNATLVNGVPSRTTATTVSNTITVNTNGFIDPYNGGTTAVGSGFISTPAANSTQTVKRYVLVPVNFDEAEFNTVCAKYSQTFEYWKVYTQDPSSYKFLASDIVKSWSASNSSYQMVTHYILLPYSYNESRLNEIINKDNGGSSNGYYAVSLTMPNKKNANDEIITINSFSTNQILYVLVPQNYDQVKVNDIEAKYNGYQYNKVYSTEPTRITSYDIIEKWTKVENSKNVTHYVLLQIGYDPTILTELRNSDLATSSSSYYIISSSYPQVISNTDTVEVMYNTAGQVGYMLIPANLDLVKYSDAEAQFTGSYKYYRTYSAVPTKLADTDLVLNLTKNNKVIYMLVPQYYDQTKVDAAFQGQRVNA
ncbi:MAG: Ig-like domain-containing protein [Oscillospiraceae bacterium]|nr:Ig-like domain-containing protein [Oscillospiraceae bacterium]